MVAVALPNIDFARIRPQDGSCHTGFEELITQLAFLEDRPADSSFVRKGRGGDGGVECFVKLASGDELGWQAKYVFDWDNSLEAQLDKSVKAALSKHPRLVTLTVCIPFDLPDGRPKAGRSARQKWEVWKSGWEKQAAALHRSLTILLWDRSALSGRLTIDKPAYSGRLLYWFETTTLTSDWFEEQFEKARAALGSRYTPDTNVELPIRKTFLAFARDPSFSRVADEWLTNVTTKGRRAVTSLELAVTSSKPQEIDELAEALTSLKVLLGTAPVGPESQFPLDTWQKSVQNCSSACHAALNWIYNQPLSSTATHGITKEDRARNDLFRLGDILQDIGTELASDKWQIANAHAVLLEGVAGTGKSHLLGDVVEHQVHAKRPALLVLGSALVEGEPWKQVMAQLDLEPNLQAKHFLGSLDAAAQAAGVRSLICIDAINERHGVDIWPDRMAAFLKMAEPFPHIGVVLSCRSTYVQHVVPDTLNDERLPRIIHHGFGESGGEAANVYLAKRGIVRPGAPNLAEEFQNPLFLKTCCDFLEKQGKNELPRGLQGISAIFSFYHEAVVGAVTKRMKLDPHLDVVSTAIERFVKLLIKRGEGYALKTEVISEFEDVHPSGGALERSLLSQLESEGVVAIELVREDDDTTAQMVRFTFERYSDHAIAAQLLQDHLDYANIAGSFAAGTTLGEIVFGTDNYRFAGLIEAIAIQLPERAGMEIVDVNSDSSWPVEGAFLESLLWREQKYFTSRTFELAKSLQTEDQFLDMLVSIATEPTNRFNAQYVHRRLSALSMPDRDVKWSVHLNRRGGEDDPVGVLIGWVIQNGMTTIEDDRAELIAIILSWFLTTSNRQVRDKATKALACLFAKRLDLAASIIRLFAQINDLYLRERLFAAAYGGALQGKSIDGLSTLADTTYSTVFSGGEPPLNELLRDHARGIAAYAQFRGHLSPTVEMGKVLPPYKSAWPIEYISEETIDGYKQDYNGHFYTDSIVSSAVHDGDFARYVVDHIVDKWAPVSIKTKKCPTTGSLARNWIKGFVARANAEQLAAFDNMKAAAKACTGSLSYAETPERSARDAAEAAFQATLPPHEWEEYRVVAQIFVRHSMFSKKSRASSARFDTRWARRWICMRAHELGWTSERFAKLERDFGGDRYDHRVERVGKKYQWLALHELVARMADNLLFMGQSYGNESRAYQGARDLNLRDMDPSLLVTKTHYDGWKQWDRTWWVPAEPRLPVLEALERLAWLDSESDLLNDASLIDLTDPKTKRRWLSLHGFASWRQSGLDSDNMSIERETWYRLTCVVVSKDNLEKVAECLKGRTLIDPHALPAFGLDSSYFIGEYPWHPTLQDLDDWELPDEWNGLAAPVRPTFAEYMCERSGHDYSIDETIQVEFPAPWLAKAMGLRLQDGQRPTFVDASGEVRFFDPSVNEPGYQAALVDRDAFLAMLERENLAAIWVIGGEKGVFGGGRPDIGFGGRVVHTAIYTLEPGGFRRALYFEREKPDAEQLEALLGSKPTPELLAKYASG